MQKMSGDRGNRTPIKWLTAIRSTVGLYPRVAVLRDNRKPLQAQATALKYAFLLSTVRSTVPALTRAVSRAEAF